MARGGDATAEPSHFHFERVSDASRIPITSKRAPTPFGGLGSQAVLIRIFRFQHEVGFFIYSCANL